MIKSEITIKDYVDGANLREVCWNQKFLEAVKKEYKLKHGEAILFNNVAQDRFRAVVCFFGSPVLVIPPIDNTEKQSLYLKQSEFFQQFTARNNKITRHLIIQADSAAVRIARRKAMAQKAKQKRTKK